ncbi:MAG: TonB-dependent receptor plug domain-containing protein [Bacteroidaceae bacterium]|nr:TonB-dependent receptor plug domain-containing protein [Bacteroidaceae bacterium]
MNRLLAVVLLAGTAQLGFAQTFTADSTKMEDLNEVVVMAVKAQPNAPFAVAKVDRKQLEGFSRSGQELPFLFARTPGVLAWSENGLGTGTTYMRIRGAGDSRINVTLDGVSLNSPEDQCVFWANMNSYASLLSNVQIQRGVGTSTNGDGAFGGTVAMTTSFPSLEPTGEVSFSYGSYNTMNYGVSASTGLLADHLVANFAWHQTQTDGFIHGTKGRSGSYMAGLTYINNGGTLKLSYKNIGNYEVTGQAWNGMTAGNDDYSLNAYDGIRTYKDMYDRGLGKFNSLYERFVPDWAGGWTTERYTMTDGSLWPRTTDNFWQNHNLLNLTWRISDHWSTTGTLHYTRGHGYYEEFRYRNKGPKKFGLPTVLSDGSSLGKEDYVRQKGMTQDTYGLVWNVNYRDDHWDVIGGASLQQFEANHYGYLTYTSNDLLRQDLFTDKGRYKYYDSDADKTDGQLFLKGMYHITADWDAFADLQFRHVSFLTNGTNDKFIKRADGSYGKHLLDISKQYNFVNPKAGLSYHRHGHSAYLSYALSHREPERNNFTDNGNYPAPRAESLHDVELGYNYQGARWHVGLGLYSMYYHDQFVQTGQVSDIGENLTTNIRRSYRLGLELTAGMDVTKWLSLEANAAISRNTIRDFDEVVETYDDDWNDLAPATVHYDNSTLAFSPTAIVNGFADFHVRGFSATWHTNFVSRQYLDNTANRDRSLPKYTQTDIHLGYDLELARKGLKHIVFGLGLNNIFNRHYARAGWVYSSIVGSAYPEQSRYYQIGYIPMAGFTAMGSVTLRF